MSIKDKLAVKFIEMAAAGTIKEIREEPERGIRNIIEKLRDLGGDKLPPEYPEAVSALLELGNPYFRLIARAAKQFEQKSLIGFGVNMGYNGFSQGAKLIREAGERYRFDIPWIAGFSYGGTALTAAKIASVISEGKSLGIFSYALFHSRGNVCDVLPAVNKHGDCAFIIFTSGEDLSPTELAQLVRCRNLMLVISSETPAYEAACQRLREAGMLYSVSSSYGPGNIADILSDKWVEAVAGAEPLLSILLPGAAADGKIRGDVEAYVAKRRAAPMQPTLLVELPSDILMINRLLGGSGCMAMFDKEGQLYGCDGRIEGTKFNLKDSNLRAILMNAYPKKSR